MLFLIIAGAAAALIIPARNKYTEAKKQVIEKKVELRTQEQTEIDLQNKKAKLENPETAPCAVERIAREKWKFCRKNEKIYTFPDTQQ